MDLCKRAICAFNGQTNKPRWTRNAAPHVWLSWECTFRLHPPLDQPAYVSLTGESYELLWLLSIATAQTSTDLNFCAQRFALQGVRVGSQFCFFFSFPLPPIARLLSSSSLSRQPAARRLSRRTRRLDKLMASRGWAAPFCAHHPPKSTQKVLHLKTFVILWWRFWKMCIAAEYNSQEPA